LCLCGKICLYPAIHILSTSHFHNIIFTFSSRYSLRLYRKKAYPSKRYKQWPAQPAQALVSEFGTLFFLYSIMEKHKTDESVKAGLQLEADTNPLKRKRKRIPLKKNGDKERDGDEMAHEQHFEPTGGHDEEDIDELVHKTPPTKTVRDNDEVDPDDLVHGPDAQEEER